MRQFTYTIKDHVNIYLAIFKEPMVAVVIIIKIIQTMNREFYKEKATVAKNERCDEFMFGTS